MEPEWSDHKIREHCIEGTRKELAAYTKAGHLQEAAIYRVGFISCQDIAADTIAKHGITLGQLKNRRGSLKFLEAKRDFIWLCYLLGKNYSVVARFLGWDRTSVYYHVKVMKSGGQWKKGRNGSTLAGHHQPTNSGAPSVGETSYPSGPETGQSAAGQSF